MVVGDNCMEDFGVFYFILCALATYLTTAARQPAMAKIAVMRR